MNTIVLGASTIHLPEGVLSIENPYEWTSPGEGMYAIRLISKDASQPDGFAFAEESELLQKLGRESFGAITGFSTTDALELDEALPINWLSLPPTRRQIAERNAMLIRRIVARQSMEQYQHVPILAETRLREIGLHPADFGLLVKNIAHSWLVVAQFDCGTGLRTVGDFNVAVAKALQKRNVIVVG